MNIQGSRLHRRLSTSIIHSSSYLGEAIHHIAIPSHGARLSCDNIFLSSPLAASARVPSSRFLNKALKSNAEAWTEESSTDSSIDCSNHLSASSLREVSFSAQDRRELIKAAAETHDDDISKISFCCLIPLLDKPGRDRAFTAALSMPSNGYAAKAYSYLAANAIYLSTAQRTELLEAVIKLDNPENRAAALAGFGSGLSSFSRGQRRQLLFTVLAMNEGNLRSRAIASISSGISAIPRDLRSVLVGEVIGLGQESLRAYGISKLLESPHALNSESRVALLNASLELKSEKNQAVAIGALAFCFKSYGMKQRSLVVSCARAIKNRAYRLVAFAGLVDHLSEAERISLVPEISRVPIEKIQSQAFSILTSRIHALDQMQHSSMLDALLNNTSGSSRIAILSNMLPALNAREREKLIAMTTGIGNHWYRAHKLYELVSGKSIDDAALLY